MRSLREQLKGYGVEIEAKYLIYRTQDRVLAVPYLQIRAIELKENKVFIYTGGIDRLVIELPSETLSQALFEDLLLHIEKLHL